MQHERNWPQEKGSSGTSRSIFLLHMEPLVHTRFACAFDGERLSYQEMCEGVVQLVSCALLRPQ